MVRVGYDSSESGAIHRTVDLAAGGTTSALDAELLREPPALSWRGALADLGLGALAPVIAALAIGVSISLMASTFWILSSGDDAATKASVALWVGRIQAMAPVFTLLATFALAARVSRRSERRAPLRGVFMTVGSTVVGIGIGAFFGARPDLGSLIFPGAVLATAQLGILLGNARAAEQRAMRDATQAMRRARTLDQVVAAAARLQGAQGRVRVALLTPESDPPSRTPLRLAPIADTDPKRLASIPLDAAPGISALVRGELPVRGATIEQRLLGRDEQRILSELGILASLWIGVRAHGGAPAVLLVAAPSNRLLRRRWLGAWQSMAAHVELAWQNLELMERERAAALRRERERLSDAIHDTLAQDLVGAVMQLEAAAASARSKAPEVAAHLEKALPPLRECLAEARRLVWASRRPAETPPLEDELAQIAHVWEREHGVAVEYDCPEAPPTLAEPARALCVRAAREALANVRKHARAGAVSVQLHPKDAGVLLEVEDDGVGLGGRSAGKDEAGGYGLHSLEQDAARLGGKLAVESREPKGTRLSLWLPTAEAISESATP